MFNLYTYEKHQNEKKKKLKDLKKLKEYEKWKEENCNKMVSNFKSRVKDFIFNMCENPYKVNDVEYKKEFEFRPEVLKGHKFHIRSFETDKERVAKYLKEHSEDYTKYDDPKYNFIQNFQNTSKTLNKLNDSRIKAKSTTNISYPDKSIYYYYINSKKGNTSNNKNQVKNYINRKFHKYAEELKSNKDKLKKITCLQPVMKFKPRTDLERIFDVINSNDFGRIDRKYVNEQLKKLNLINVQESKYTDQNEYSNIKEKLRVSPQLLKYLITEKKRLEKNKEEDINGQNEEFLNNINNIIRINQDLIVQESNAYKTNINNNKNIVVKRFDTSPRKNLNNSLAKNFLKEYQTKTYFKEASTFALNLEGDYDVINGNAKKSNIKYNNNEYSPYNQTSLNYINNNKVNSRFRNLSNFNKKNNIMFSSNDIYSNFNNNPYNNKNSLLFKNYNFIDNKYNGKTLTKNFSTVNTKSNNNKSSEFAKKNQIYNSIQSLNFNPLTNIKKKNMDDSYDKLNDLKELIKKENEANSNNLMKLTKFNDFDYDKEYNKERKKNYLLQMNTINVDGEIIDKKDLPKISTAMLRECNIFRKKYKINN